MTRWTDETELRPAKVDRSGRALRDADFAKYVTLAIVGLMAFLGIVAWFLVRYPM